MIIPVELGKCSYDIMINETGTITKKAKELFPKKRFVIITNTTLEKIYALTIKEWQKNLAADVLTIKDGEEYKRVSTWEFILTYLLEKRYDRNTILIAFGGGVIGDIVGFVAATFLRGIKFIQVPTTLLAMVDSSIGGKTAINHSMGKNLIGAFYQPSLVWIDTTMLDTLDERQFNAGYAEIFKYGFIAGIEMSTFIKKNHSLIINRKHDILYQAILCSVKIKSKIVIEDELEAGKRMLLNFGHTFGHALEKQYNYKNILHGEAVYWGIICAVELGKRIGTIKDNQMGHFDSFILMNKQLLIQLPSLPDIFELYNAMQSDKKVNDGKIRFILPTDIGTVIIKDDIKKDDVISVLKMMFSDLNTML